MREAGQGKQECGQAFPARPTSYKEFKMFKNLTTFFSREDTSLQFDKDGQPTPQELKVATIVLMVEMAGSDKNIAAEEAETVCRSIGREFSISEEEIPELVKIAIEARRVEGKIDQFVSCINEKFDDQQKILVLAMIWRVVQADGKIDAFESKFAAQLQNRLQLDDSQATEARKIAASDVAF